MSEARRPGPSSQSCCRSLRRRWVSWCAWELGTC